MGKWISRLKSKAPDTLPEGTDETHKTAPPDTPDPVVSVLAVRAERGAANSSEAARAASSSQSCADCASRLRAGTCGKPMAAGLRTEAEGFGIVWPPAGFGADCRAWQPRARQSDHADPAGGVDEDGARDVGPWDDENITRFLDRRARLLRWGWPEPEAEKLAERLVKRDRQTDDRVSCADCRHCGGATCRNHGPAGMGGPALPRALVGMLQRCPGHQTIRD